MSETTTLTETMLTLTLNQKPDSTIENEVDLEKDVEIKSMTVKNMVESLSKQDENDQKKFVEDQEISTLLELANAAYSLDIKKETLDIVCQKIADMIKDKSVEEVREIFNIKNDFTPEEEQASRSEYAWAFES
ncbi:unnamed protein product [Lactuca virosa]|uniref:SKP1 component dimerisation domain-containing protein n=1 Tax=Lactuca virosa TaxID=75947 RepID=A0AAU9LED1_9ASTR|nr:unnamed protein product [Lactuca virosa]